jgi:hypothetical protein
MIIPSSRCDAGLARGGNVQPRAAADEVENPGELAYGGHAIAVSDQLPSDSIAGAASPLVRASFSADQHPEKALQTNLQIGVARLARNRETPYKP